MHKKDCPDSEILPGQFLKASKLTVEQCSKCDYNFKCFTGLETFVIYASLFDQSLRGLNVR